MKKIILLLATVISVTSCVAYGHYSANELPNTETANEKEFFDSAAQDLGLFLPNVELAEQIDHIKAKLSI